MNRIYVLAKCLSIIGNVDVEVASLALQIFMNSEKTDIKKIIEALELQERINSMKDGNALVFDSRHGWSIIESEHGNIRNKAYLTPLEAISDFCITTRS
jgi:hypothetical protein